MQAKQFCQGVVAAIVIGWAGLAGASTFVYLDSSDVGDWIGRGETYLFTEADGVFSPTVSAGNGRVQISYASDDYWNFEFDAPDPEPLAPGLYEGATRYPFNSSTGPGLSVSGAGRGCNTLTGEFLVHEAEFSVEGTLERFAVDFVQHCDGDPPLFGAVRYQSLFSVEGLNDLDLDGVPDLIDNCEATGNADQADVDFDGLGDACDPYPNEPDNLDQCLQGLAPQVGECEAELLSCYETTSGLVGELTTSEAGLTICAGSLFTCQADLTQAGADIESCNASRVGLESDVASCGDQVSAAAVEIAALEVERDALVAAAVDTDADGVHDLVDSCSATPLGEGVDDSGCSLPQFCSSVDVNEAAGRRACKRLDWQNDEPIMRGVNRDCTRLRNGSAQACVPSP
jgi:hypothetical protein